MAADLLRQQLMNLTDMVAPLHEWLTGEINYFKAQGFTDREAQAMAASTYVTVFGCNIHPAQPS